MKTPETGMKHFQLTFGASDEHPTAMPGRTEMSQMSHAYGASRLPKRPKTTVLQSSFALFLETIFSRNWAHVLSSRAANFQPF